ncbi:MAG TPA: hypothetical protein VFQ53_06365 [Kofleriaceae bacterium]|nr:hypothetical protein [Kofleriaceae bacterium]
MLLSITAGCPAPKPAAKPPTTRPATLDPIGRYAQGGDCAVGTPENPTCTQRLELVAGGTGTFIGDDIAERATWTVTGDEIRVVIGERSMTLKPSTSDALVDDHGLTWRKVP